MPFCQPISQRLPLPPLLLSRPSPPCWCRNPNATVCANVLAWLCYWRAVVAPAPPMPGTCHGHACCVPPPAVTAPPIWPPYPYPPPPPEPALPWRQVPPASFLAGSRATARARQQKQDTATGYRGATATGYCDGGKPGGKAPPPAACGKRPLIFSNTRMTCGGRRRKEGRRKA